MEKEWILLILGTIMLAFFLIVTTMDGIGRRPMRTVTGIPVYRWVLQAGGAATNPEDERRRREEERRLREKERKRNNAEKRSLRALERWLVRYCDRYCNGQGVCGPLCPSGRSELDIKALAETLAYQGFEVPPGAPIEEWKKRNSLYKRWMDVFPDDPKEHILYELLKIV